MLAAWVLVVEVRSGGPFLTSLAGVVGIVLIIESIVFFLSSMCRARWSVWKLMILGIFLWLAVGYGKWMWLSWHSKMAFIESFRETHPGMEFRPHYLPWWRLNPLWWYVGAVLLFVFGFLFRREPAPSRDTH